MADKKVRIWNHEGNDFIDVLYHDNEDGTYSQVFITIDPAGNIARGLTYAELLLAPLDVAGPLTNDQLRALEVAVSGPLTNAELRASPISVSGPLTDDELRATPIAISGGLSDDELRATPIAISGALTDTELRATPLSVSGPLTDDELRATAIAVSGPLTDNELRAASIPVVGPLTDTELRATPIVISGVLTDDELRASPISVSGPLTDTELRATPIVISGPLTDDELRATAIAVSGPLTDTELRESPLSVSGPLTDTEIRASALPVSISGVAQDGTDITTPTAMPAGGTGIRGWLSAIWTKLNGSLGVIPEATELHLGAIGGHTSWVDLVINMSSHSNYISGDFVGVDGTPITIPDCARIVGGTGVIIGAILTDRALQSIPGELWLFDTSITPPNDSAPWVISDADAAKCIGVIPFFDYFIGTSNCVSPVGNLTIGFRTGSSVTSLFGCFVTDGAPVYDSGDVSIRLCILKD